MIRILHVTDFHLNNRTLRDWNDHYKESFIKKINEFQQRKKIDLVAFTGDLIDKGGKDFGGATFAFEKFNEHIIIPILQALELDISRFIICPGNHDINRAADDEIDENGLKSTLTPPNSPRLQRGLLRIAFSTLLYYIYIFTHVRRSIFYT